VFIQSLLLLSHRQGVISTCTMWLLSYLSLLGLINAVSCLQFINPPPAGMARDYSFNAVFSIGSKVDIEWTLGSGDISPMSLTLFQDIPDDAFEYVFRMRSLSFPIHSPLGYLTDSSFKENTNAYTTSFSWTVDTCKNLSLSHAFFFAMFPEGSTSPSADSHYFNITATDVFSGATTPTISQSATLASPLTNTGTSTATSSANTFTTATAMPSSNGLSGGAKAGLAFGIIIAIMLGLSAGWYFFGRRRRQDASIPAIQSDGYQEIDKQGRGMPPVYVESVVVPSVWRYELEAPT
jgi:hypothetical protein